MFGLADNSSPRHAALHVASSGDASDSVHRAVFTLDVGKEETCGRTLIGRFDTPLGFGAERVTRASYLC